MSPQPDKTTVENNHPTLLSRSLLQNSLPNSNPSQERTSQQPCILPFFAKTNSL